jgi:hypothetical protein
MLSLWAFPYQSRLILGLAIARYVCTDDPQLHWAPILQFVLAGRYHGRRFRASRMSLHGATCGLVVVAPLLTSFSCPLLSNSPFPFRTAHLVVEFSAVSVCLDVRPEKAVWRLAGAALETPVVATTKQVDGLDVLSSTVG